MEPGMRPTLMRVLSVVAFCSVLAALAQTGTPKKPPPRPGAGASEDRQLEAAIRARFADSGIASDKFTVHVQGGVATLEGHTEVLQHKGVATRLAKSMGALQVVNRIEISEAAREKAAANLAQGRRRAQVKRSDARSERR
jgi:osmotically-inducible protein OsmY